MSDKDSMVVQREIEIAGELSAAEREADTVSERYDHDEVMAELRFKIAAAQKSK